MDETQVSTDDHQVLRGLFLALLALMGGLTLSVLLGAGTAFAASPPAAPSLRGEIVEGVDAGGGVGQTEPDVESVGAAVDEVVAGTPVADALPSVQSLVNEASSAVNEAVEPLLTRVDRIGDSIEQPLPPLPLPAPESETPANGSGEPAAASAPATPAESMRHLPDSSAAQVFASADAVPDADRFGWPDDVDLQPLPPTTPGAPGSTPPAGTSGPSSGASGGALLASVDAFPSTSLSSGPSSHLERDDVPASPTYESDTTPD